MTDMTTEQALEAVTRLIGLAHSGDFYGDYDRACKTLSDARMALAALSRPAVPELLDADKVHAEKEALDVCPHGVRRPHECKECADAVPASEALEWAEREFAAARQSPGEPVQVETTAEEPLTAEQPEDGPVAEPFGWDSAVDTAKRVEREVHPCNMQISTRLVIECDQFLASVKAERDVLRERVKELAEIIGDIKRWDISNLLLDIPHPLRKRMQAVLAAMQEGKS